MPSALLRVRQAICRPAPERKPRTTQRRFWLGYADNAGRPGGNLLEFHQSPGHFSETGDPSMIATASKPIRKRRQTRARRCTFKNAYTRFFARVQYGPNLYVGYYAQGLEWDPLGSQRMSCGHPALVPGNKIIPPANGKARGPTITISDCTILVMVGHNFRNDSAPGLQQLEFSVPNSKCFKASFMCCFAHTFSHNNNPNMPSLNTGGRLPKEEIGRRAVTDNLPFIIAAAEKAADDLGKCPCCCEKVRIEVVSQQGNPKKGQFWIFRYPSSKTVDVTPDPCCTVTRGAGSVTFPSKRDFKRFGYKN